MELRFTPTEEDVRDLCRVNVMPGWYVFLFYLLLILSFVIAVHLIEHDMTIAGWAWLVATAVIALVTYELPRLRARRSDAALRVRENSSTR
jgi:hypothetical protein